MTFSIGYEWLEAPGVRDIGQASTWARVAMSLRGPLLILDEKRKVVREGYYGSLLPFVEWLVEAWPRLIHERRLPAAGDDRRRREWRYFHDFRAGRGGGVIPDICIRRHDDSTLSVMASHDRHLAPGITVRFLRDAKARIPATEVTRALGELIEATLEQLGAVDETEANDLRSRWLAARSRSARVAAVLGVNPGELDELDESDLAALLDPENSLALSFAEASTLPDLGARVEEALRLAREIPYGVTASSTWNALRRETVSRRKHPWLTGWDAAEEFRRAVRVEQNFAPGADLRQFLETSCGWPVEAQVRRSSTVLTGVDTVHVQRRHQMPVVVTSAGTPPSVRFRIARSLYYFLFAHADGTQKGIADSALLPEFSEANAFAAELLAPAEILRHHAPPGRVWTLRDIRAAARELKVSPYVVRHQVDNRSLGSSSDLS